MRQRFERLVFAAGATVVIAATAQPALADVNELRAESILFEPNNPSHIVVRFRYWGLLESRDAGRTWGFVCSDAFGLDEYDDYEAAIAADGRILIGGVFNGLWMSDDGCNFRSVPSPAEPFVSGIAPVDAAGQGWLMITSEGHDQAISAHLHRSSDRGESWAPVGGALPNQVVPTALAVAPSDAQRVYVVGRILDGPLALMASEDGGEIWQLHEIGPETGVTMPSIGFIHPRDRSSVLVRLSPVASDDTTDHLWVTPDGGATWAHVYGQAGGLPGQVLSPDGTQLLVSGPLAGIRAAPLATVFSGRTDVFEPLLSATTFALGSAAGRVLVGTDHLTDGSSGYLLSAADASFHLTGIASFRNIKLACPEGTTVAAECQESWKTVEDILAPLSRPADPTGSGGADASGGANPGDAPNPGHSAEGKGASLDGGGAGGTTSERAGEQDDTRKRAIERVSCTLSPGHRGAPSATMLLVVYRALLCVQKRRRRWTRRSMLSEIDNE